MPRCKANVKVAGNTKTEAKIHRLATNFMHFSFSFQQRRLSVLAATKALVLHFGKSPTIINDIEEIVFRIKTYYQILIKVN